MSGEELIAITEKANRSNLSISDYVRKTALNRRVIEFCTDDFQMIITELRSSGSALCEILKAVRSNSAVDAKILEEAINDNRETERRVVDAFIRLWL